MGLGSLWGDGFGYWGYLGGGLLGVVSVHGGVWFVVTEAAHVQWMIVRLFDEGMKGRVWWRSSYDDRGKVVRGIERMFLQGVMPVNLQQPGMTDRHDSGETPTGVFPQVSRLRSLT